MSEKHCGTQNNDDVGPNNNHTAENSTAVARQTEADHPSSYPNTAVQTQNKVEHHQKKTDDFAVVVLSVGREVQTTASIAPTEKAIIKVPELANNEDGKSECSLKQYQDNQNKNEMEAAGNNNMAAIRRECHVESSSKICHNNPGATSLEHAVAMSLLSGDLFRVALPRNNDDAWKADENDHCPPGLLATVADEDLEEARLQSQVHDQHGARAGDEIMAYDDDDDPDKPQWCLGLVLFLLFGCAIGVGLGVMLSCHDEHESSSSTQSNDNAPTNVPTLLLQSTANNDFHDDPTTPPTFT